MYIDQNTKKTKISFSCFFYNQFSFLILFFFILFYVVLFLFLLLVINKSTRFIAIFFYSYSFINIYSSGTDYLQNDELHQWSYFLYIRYYNNHRLRKIIIRRRHYLFRSFRLFDSNKYDSHQFLFYKWDLANKKK
jgi:hypothetical protein